MEETPSNASNIKIVNGIILNAECLEKKRNYYFKGNVAYTEDGVVVHKIFVYRIPLKVTVKQLFEYFRRFGRVAEVRIHSRTVALNVAFVYFLDPFAAARVLEYQVHYNLEMRKMFVTACYSWNQPKMKEAQLMKVIRRMEEESNITSQFHILQLDDDSLLTICEKLDLQNQINFALTCKEFLTVFKMHAKSKHKVVKIGHNPKLALFQWRDFFKISGRCVREIFVVDVSSPNMRLVNFVGKFCPNVTILRFESMSITYTILNMILSNIRNVTTLQLNACIINKNTFADLKQWPKLEELYITPFSFFTHVQHLNEFENLRKLSIKGCTNLHEEYIIPNSIGLEKLTSLSFCVTHLECPKKFREILKNCINLETLETDVSIVESLELLKKLKNLKTQTTYHTCHQLITKLAEQQPEQLECLHISCWTYKDTKRLFNLEELKQLSCWRNRNINDLKHTFRKY